MMGTGVSGIAPAGAGIPPEYRANFECLARDRSLGDRAAAYLYPTHLRFAIDQ